MIVIIDLGSQYTHVIWRTVRELGYDPLIVPADETLESMSEAKGFILSGGPGSAPDEEAGASKQIILDVMNGKLETPILGICLGHQLIAHVLGGKVDKGANAEYGIMKIFVDEPDDLFKDVSSEFDAWVSHFDEVKQLPEGFASLAHSEACKCEAMKHKEKPVYGVQFHPEVWHTEHGQAILANFLTKTK